jgi:hypothetical protein
MEQDQNPPGAVPKKKSKRTLIIVLIVLAVLAIPTCSVVGILVAVAIPALAVAKQDARNVIASQVFSGVEVAKQKYIAKEGRNPRSWDDISPYLEFKGQTLSSSGELMERALGGGKLEIRGIDGATETKIILKDGNVITPESAKSVSNLYQQGEGRSRSSVVSEASEPSESPDVPNLDNLDPQQLMTALMESGESLEKVHNIMGVSQKYYEMVDWQGLARLPSQSEEEVSKLYTIFTTMGQNSLTAMPLLEQLKQTSLPPEITKLYQNIVENNVAMCSAAQKFIKAYRETGELDKQRYGLIIQYDKKYAQALQAFMEFDQSLSR